MKSFAVLIVVCAVVFACGGATATTSNGPSTPPGPLTKYSSRLPGLNATGTIDLIQNVIDFGPGAASAVHIHTTPNLATVLMGQITVKTPAGDKQAAAGDMLVEPVDQALQAVNTGSGETMVVVAFVVPHGAKPTTPVAGKPAPATPNKTLYAVTLSSPGVSGPYGLVQQVLTFAPGSQTPRYRLGGTGVITVLQGPVVVNVDGVERTLGTGESFNELSGQTLQTFNQGSSQAMLAETFLVPDGAKLTNP